MPCCCCCFLELVSEGYFCFDVFKIACAVPGENSVLDYSKSDGKH